MRFLLKPPCQTNVILSNGSNWQRHSRVVKSALQRCVLYLAWFPQLTLPCRNLPIEDFVTLANRLFRVMKDGGKLRWDDLAMVGQLHDMLMAPQ